MIDADFGRRLEILTELMEKEPNRPVRKLQAEALKYYPLNGIEARRAWLAKRTAFLAADIINKKREIP